MTRFGVLCTLLSVFQCIPLRSCSDEKFGDYTNTWAVEVNGGENAAKLLADLYGMRLVGRLGTLDNVFLFENRRLQKRSITEHGTFTEAVQHDPRVRWAEQQRILKRVKRDFGESRERSRVRPAIDSTNSQNRSPSGKLSQTPHSFQYNDAYFDQQWYIHGYVGAHVANVADMKVQQAWNRSYSGKGVVVTILDDGIEHTHSDLIDNYDPMASADLNGRDRDPFPRYDVTNENRHGTRCAGVVAAKANNSVCVVGIAHDARVGGVRMLDGDITDAVEAAALSLSPQHIDIYSASWGPDDSGSVVDGPGPLALKAFQQGVERGRGGLGSIYVWASGNGGGSDDSCALDGYANAIYTLSVGSVSQWNVRPWYLEECASTLVTTYSSGEPREAQVASTDIHNRCTLQHTGTSASAPLAAGIIALVLEANSQLTWRDVQYITILAANHTPFKDANWIVNGVKRKVSLRYGYGLMNAYSMVRLAEAWSTVPPQLVCRAQPDASQRRRSLANVREVTVTLNAERCAYVPNRNGASHWRSYSSGNSTNSVSVIRYLEHVQAVVTLRYQRRGDLQITLVSPSGTKSVLMPKRRYDYKSDGLNNWVLTSVHFWGESPAGVWKLIFENVGFSRHFTGELTDWSLVFYGVGMRPIRIRRVTYHDGSAPVSVPHAETTPPPPPPPPVFEATSTRRRTSTTRNPFAKPAACPDCTRPRSRNRNKSRDEFEADDVNGARTKRERRTEITAAPGIDFEPYVSPEVDARLAAMHAIFIGYDGPCHSECVAECIGPADHDCYACRHSRMLDRYGLHRCIPFAEDLVDDSDSEGGGTGGDTDERPLVPDGNEYEREPSEPVVSSAASSHASFSLGVERIVNSLVCSLVAFRLLRTQLQRPLS